MKQKLFFFLFFFVLMCSIGLFESTKTKNKNSNKKMKFPFRGFPKLNLKLDFKQIAKAAIPLINNGLKAAKLPTINTIKTLIKCAKDLVSSIKKLIKNPLSVLQLLKKNEECLDAIQEIAGTCDSPVIIGLSAAPYVGGPITFICSKMSVVTLKIESIRQKIAQFEMKVAMGLNKIKDIVSVSVENSASSVANTITNDVNTSFYKKAKSAKHLQNKDTLVSN
jgi:hypothetical protein